MAKPKTVKEAFDNKTIIKDMKFTVNTKTLSKALSYCSYITTRHKHIPQIENVLFEIENDVLFLVATDLEITTRIKIPIFDNKDKFSVIVPIELISKTMSVLPDVPITIDIDMDTYKITIQYEEDIFTMVGESSITFPIIPSFESKVNFSINSQDLLKAIKYTVYATDSEDAYKPYDNCVSLQINKVINLYATNGSMLAKYTFPKDFDLEEAITCNMTKKTALTINKYITSEKDITFSFDYRNIIIQIEDITIYAKLQEATYPNVEAVMPNDNPITIKVPRKELLQSIKNVSLYCNESNNQIKIILKDDEISLMAENTDIKKKASIKMKCENESNAIIDIGFNHKLLTNILSVYTDDNVYIHMNTPNRAVILNEELNNNVTTLLMPVMLNY